MLVTLDQYIELRGDNVLAAVVKGTEANAYLVATATLAQGAEATAEQYHISLAQVHGTLAFYYENQTEIEKRYRESEARLEEHAVDGWHRLDDMRKRKGYARE
ncbi:MAG: hypothetical protein L0154_00430 [Chloroflexi bacterium]|nr:hypothetical protein [Chloroflexota bacterium]